MLNIYDSNVNIVIFIGGLVVIAKFYDSKTVQVLQRRVEVQVLQRRVEGLADSST